MRRFATRTLLAAASAALAAVLLIAGGLALWGSAYVHNTVRGQLAAQQIFFPPQAAFAHPKAGTEITPSMIPLVSQYAGQQMLTGQRSQLAEDEKRYQRLIEDGVAALSQYEREIAHGGNDDLAWASAIAIKYNHISGARGRIRWLERQLGTPHQR